MDLLRTLRSKLSVVPRGDHSSGLAATLSHIDIAFEHIVRGQEQGEMSAFTDAVYRSNQAFEGSIKEAYRVLAGKDPARKKPFEIERYLETNSVFRDRVLNQFKAYRQDWRNPSTHNYVLTFDESEAFLAIVSVAAFACVLIDQIAERIAFESINQMAASRASPDWYEKYFLDSLYGQIASFLKDQLSQFSFEAPPGATTEVVLIGSLHGLLDAAFPDLRITTDSLLFPDSRDRADMLISNAEETMLVEIKHATRAVQHASNIEQVQGYLERSKLNRGLLVYVPQAPEPAELRSYSTRDLEIGFIASPSSIKLF